MHKSIKRDGSHLHCEYTFDEFVDIMENVAGSCIDNVSNRKKSNSSAFHYTDSYKDAWNLVRNGWTDGLEETNRIKSSIVGKIKGQIHAIEYGYEITGGLMVDVSRHLSGEPECFIVERESERLVDGNKLCRIVYNCSTSCRVDANTMVKRGAICAAVIELLELSGVRTQVDVVEPIKGDKGTCQISVTVKQYDDQLDMGRIAATIGQPDWLRRVLFQFQESPHLFDAKDRSNFGFCNGGSFGIPIPAEDKGDVYFCDALLSDNNTEAQYTKLIIDTLRSQGVVIEEQ